MQLPPLHHGTLIQRYKRFMADIELADGSTLTLHCANTGRMSSCGSAGDKIWYSNSHNLTRKYPCSWEITQLEDNTLVCINTHRANDLVAEAIEYGIIPELNGYTNLQREVKYGEENSRIDILLTKDNGDKCYVEVKSITLMQEQEDVKVGMFPDAQTTRGQKHLRELMHMRKQGKRAVILFCGLRNDFTQFKVAQHIDPAYAKLFSEALVYGVEAYTYQCEFKYKEQLGELIPSEIYLKKLIDIIK